MNEDVLRQARLVEQPLLLHHYRPCIINGFRIERTDYGKFQVLEVATGKYIMNKSGTKTRNFGTFSDTVYHIAAIA